MVEGDCLGNPAGGAGIRGSIPRLGAASFLPYPNSFLLVGKSLAKPPSPTVKKAQNNKVYNSLIMLVLE